MIFFSARTLLFKFTAASAYHLWWLDTCVIWNELVWSSQGWLSIMVAVALVAAAEACYAGFYQQIQTPVLWMKGVAISSHWKNHRDPVGASCSIIYHSMSSKGLQGPLIDLWAPIGLLLPLQEIQIPVLWQKDWGRSSPNHQDKSP
jgi:hypothetical protein